MSVNGNAGVSFDVAETDITVATGTVTQTHAVESSIAELTISSTALVYSISGSVGTSAFDLNLNALDNQSGSGYSTTVIRNNAGDFTTLQMIVIHNKHASNNLIIGSPSANSLFTWNSASDGLAIPPGGAFSMTLPTALTIGSNGKLNFKGSSASTTFEVYILGA